jgi:hypothetical protein
VWRLQDKQGSATNFHPFGEDVLVNMSVWVDIESLYNTVYRSAHIEIMAKRKQWFEILREAYSVLWWIPVGTFPTMGKAQEKLELLRMKGSSLEAFTFKDAFTEPDHSAVGDSWRLVISMIVA